MVLQQLAPAQSRVHAAQPVEVGYRDFTRAAGCTAKATAEKPESKLWFHDGSWWGVLCTSTSADYHLYRLDLASQSWIDTGIPADERGKSRADALWDETTQKLYIASHLAEEGGQFELDPDKRGRLYRYGYDAGSQQYQPDPGFPVVITDGQSKTLAIAKDSTGQLWATYVMSNTVMINHSNGDDATQWGQPFPLPVPHANDLTDNDISSIIAFGPQHIAILWSNQTTGAFYVAVHTDGTPDQTWSSSAIYTLSSDDHINLKTFENKVYAVVKTAISDQIILLICTYQDGAAPCATSAEWTAYPVYQSGEGNPTRPIVLLDTARREIYVFATLLDALGGITYKRTSTDNIQFSAGLGTPFIRSSQDPDTNNPTSTKQNLDVTSGLVVLASDVHTRAYLHNYDPLGGSLLLGTVQLQGRPAPPHPQWQVPLNLRLTRADDSTTFLEYSTTTDKNGAFTLAGIPPATYDIQVKNPHTLQNVRRATLQAGHNPVDFGTLREGDANGDNFVTLTDLSILIATFGKAESDPGFDERADFNTDHFISLLDFSLLASNFSQAGDSLPTTLIPSGQPASIPQQPVGVEPAPVLLAVSPPTTTLQTGQTFDVPLVIEAGPLPVDGGAAYLTFDPAVLQVEEIQPGSLLPIELTRQFDNVRGRVHYAAGTFDSFPTGTVLLATIRFRALAPAAGTLLNFEAIHPRKSHVTFGGASVLTATVNGQISIQGPASETPICPDFNGDDRVDTSDIAEINSRWRLTPLATPATNMPPYESRFDLDSDQAITVRDITLILHHWGKNCE